MDLETAKIKFKTVEAEKEIAYKQEKLTYITCTNCKFHTMKPGNFFKLGKLYCAVQDYDFIHETDIGALQAISRAEQCPCFENMHKKEETEVDKEEKYMWKIRHKVEHFVQTKHDLKEIEHGSNDYFLVGSMCEIIYRRKSFKGMTFEETFNDSDDLIETTYKLLMGDSKWS